MTSILFQSESEEDLKLLTNLAYKIGIKTQILSNEILEDIAMANAIEVGRTNEYIDTEEFMSQVFDEVNNR
ncbi:MAG: hypothetical protein ACOVNU_03620 [Candidatus Kapaibacteriota bacterium]|jgi:hypothetical protein